MSSIWEIAKGMEVEGKKFYEQLSLQASNKALEKAFSLLADAEQKHYETFESLEKSMPVESSAAPSIGVDIKKAFKEIAEDLTKPDTGMEVMADAETAYEKALSMEEKGIEFYSDMLEKTDDNLQKTMIEQIITEEKSHVKIVSNLLEFARDPKIWIENAEFNHLDEY